MEYLIHFQSIHLYRGIVSLHCLCFILLYFVNVLYRCFVEFTQINEQIRCRNFSRKFQKGGLFSFFTFKTLSVTFRAFKKWWDQLPCSPKHVVDLSLYVKTWLQESTFLVFVSFEGVDIKEVTRLQMFDHSDVWFSKIGKKVVASATTYHTNWSISSVVR